MPLAVRADAIPEKFRISTVVNIGSEVECDVFAAVECDVGVKAADATVHRNPSYPNGRQEDLGRSVVRCAVVQELTADEILAAPEDGVVRWHIDARREAVVGTRIWVD